VHIIRDYWMQQHRLMPLKTISMKLQRISTEL
jgi:hypothetical protein